MSRERVVVAMSGGVDSAVAAARCVAAGHDVVGISLRLVRDGNGSCCSLDDFHDARSVADRLGFPHYVFDFTDVFERMLDLAGELGAAVNIGGSRGNAIPGLEAREMDALTTGVFEQLAARAERVGAKILLEPTGDYTSYITTMDEVRAWVERIGSAAFGLMLDTYQLHEAEPSIEYGIRAAAGRATHVHLYDPSRWPPGVLSEVDRLDWPRIVRVLREEGFSGSGSVVLVPEGPPEEPARTSAAYLRALFDED